MTEQLSAILNQLLNDQVHAGEIPGAVYAVVTGHDVLAEGAVGFAHLPKKLPMRLGTRFDLASLTKVCATLPAILCLVEAGRVDFDDPLSRFFPETENSQLTLRHLLTHTSGFPPSFPFYQYRMSKSKAAQFIVSINHAVGQAVCYSDLNFILLGMLVERLSGDPLEQFVQKHIYQPLGMTHTGYCPNAPLTDFAATEWMTEEKDYRWGQVHDENAFYMKGVSGHAGLFSDLHDLAVYTQMLMNGGRFGNNQSLFSPALLAACRRNYTERLGDARGFGWQLAGNDCTSAGYLLSPTSYGHTGFTGTSIWIDPEAQLGFILLSNRVHISRSINMNRIRRLFHNVARAQMAKEGGGAR
ncbi:MAG: serine hydrolase [Sporolactobacillus sp.]